MCTATRVIRIANFLSFRDYTIRFRVSFCPLMQVSLIMEKNIILKKKIENSLGDFG